MILGRRKFLIGLSAVMVAPAIVSVANIMPVKQMIPEIVASWDYIRVNHEKYTTFLHYTPVDMERLEWMKAQDDFINIQKMKWNPNIHEVGGISDDLRAAFKEHGL